MAYMLQIRSQEHIQLSPSPTGLISHYGKQQVLYRLYTLVYFFRINQLNMSVTEHTLQKFTNLKYLNRLNIDIYWKTNTLWIHTHDYVN